MKQLRFRSKDLRYVGGAALAAALLTALFALMEYPDPPPDPSDPSLVTAAPDTSRPAVAPPAPAPAAKPAPRPIRLDPPYEIGDGLTILTETKRVRLIGLEGPPREGVCFDPENRLWACGLQARAALNNLIRLKPVTCTPVGPPVANVPQVACAVDGDDVGRALVLAGWARPTFEDAVLRAAEADARGGSKGLWNGGWRVRP